MRIVQSKTDQIPSHQLLLSVSGDSRSSLQHSSIQQLSLSAIPEDYELTDDYQYEEQQIVTEEEIDDTHVVIQDPAPDGGYGWIIVLASFLSNLIVDGIAYTFGLFFDEFMNHFQTTKAKTALVGSLLNGFYLSAGPLISAMVNRFGCRSVSIAGSIVASTAFVLSIFAPNIEVLMLTYGVMGGIGFGLIYLPAIVSVGYYFNTKRAFATGIAVCGSGVGAFLFAPFCQYLLNVYDWKNVLLILAGLILNCAIFGSLIRPLTVQAETVMTDEPYQRPPGSKSLMQRIAEEKRRRLLSHSNSFLLIQSGTDVDSNVRPSRILVNTEPGVHSTLYLDQLFAQPPQGQLSPIVERRHFSEGSTPSLEHGSPVTEKGTPTPEKDADNEMHLQDSAISLTGEYAFPSTTTIAQTPPPEGPTGSLGGSIQLIRQSRPRRTQRTISECSAPPVQVILSSGTPSHSRRTSIVKSTQSITQPIIVRPLYKKDIFYAGSINQLIPNASVRQLAESQGVIGGSMMTSVVSIPTRDILERVQRDLTLRETDDATDGGATKSEDCCTKLRSLLDKWKKKKESADNEDVPKEESQCFPINLPPSMKDVIREMFDFSLLSNNKAFRLLTLSNVFGMMGFYVPFVYLTQYAVSNVYDGAELMSNESSATLISLIGITNTFGRLLFGWISDKITKVTIFGGRRITALTINNICLIGSGLTVIAVPLCKTYNLILIDCVLFGFFVSAYICLTSIILVDLLGLERLTNAFGLLCLFRGTSTIVGPPIAGIIFDMTESYHITFGVSGTLLIVSAIISFMVPNRTAEDVNCPIEEDCTV